MGKNRIRGIPVTILSLGFLSILFSSFPYISHALQPYLQYQKNVTVLEDKIKQGQLIRPLSKKFEVPFSLQKVIERTPTIIYKRKGIPMHRSQTEKVLCILITGEKGPATKYISFEEQRRGAGPQISLSLNAETVGAAGSSGDAAYDKEEQNSASMNSAIMKSSIGITGRQMLAMDTDVSGVITGIFFILFLCHGMFLLIFKRYKVNLYFAILCLSWSLRFAGRSATGKAMWCSNLSGNIVMRLEYAYVGIAVLFILLILWEIFPGCLSLRLKRIVQVYTALYFLLCIFSPGDILSNIWIPCVLGFLFAGIWGSAVILRYFIRKHKQKELKEGQGLLFLGFSAFFFTACHDIFYYAGISHDGVFHDLGFMVFAVLQMVANLSEIVHEMKCTGLMAEKTQIEAEGVYKISKMKEELLGNLSHELQIPITVMSGFAQLTRKMVEESDLNCLVIQDNMLRIEEEAVRMEKMVNMLLDTAAMENGSFTLQRRQMDFAALVQSIAKTQYPMLNNKGNHLVLQLDSPLMIYADKERLQQVLLNLLSNAMKYTENGTIIISARKESSCCAVEISDTGCGIAPELLCRLFQRFSKDVVTGKNGLGLFICKQLVEAHGGTIEIHSVLQKGTSVQITLPLNGEVS